MKTTATSNFTTYMAAMKSIDIPDKMPRSQARRLADEQLSRAVQVTHPSSPMVLSTRTCQGQNGAHTGSHPPPLNFRPPQDMAVRQFLLTNLVEVDGRFQWRVNLDALTKHLDEIMNFPPQQESYSGPTLFLLGGNSRYVW